MQQKNKGYVLLVVLIFLVLFCLLSAQSMTSLTLAKKEVVTIRGQNQIRGMAEDLLNQLGHQTPTTCIRDKVSPHFLQRQTLAWWKEHACYGYGRYGEYYYFHENLMRDECATIEGHEFFAAQYYRTTLFYPSGRAVIVQDTTAVPDVTPVHCKGSLIVLKAGRQALRWLYN